MRVRDTIERPAKVRMKDTGPKAPRHERDWFKRYIAGINAAFRPATYPSDKVRQRRRLLARQSAKVSR